MAKKHKQGVVTDKSQVPDGFVDANVIAANDTSLSKRIRSAAQRGIFPSYKHMSHPGDRNGAVYVHEAEVKAYLEKKAAKPVKEDPQKILFVGPDADEPVKMQDTGLAIGTALNNFCDRLKEVEEAFKRAFIHMNHFIDLVESLSKEVPDHPEA